MNIPKKIILCNEDGKQEITIQDCFLYCGEVQVKKALQEGKNCTLNNILEYDGYIKFIF